MLLMLKVAIFIRSRSLPAPRARTEPDDRGVVDWRCPRAEASVRDLLSRLERLYRKAMRIASMLSAAMAWIAASTVGVHAEPVLAAPETSICLMLESAAHASDLPVDFFVRV